MVLSLLFAYVSPLHLAPLVRNYSLAPVAHELLTGLIVVDEPLCMCVAAHAVLTVLSVPGTCPCLQDMT